MRINKYRAWDGKRMTTSGIMFNNSTGCIDLPIGAQMKLMQFTGLHDKNGKEIYENDVLSVDKIASLYKNCPITVIGVVVYTNGRYEVETKKVINKKFSEQLSIHFGMKVMDWIHLPEFHKSEIIGNIHENKELL